MHAPPAHMGSPSLNGADIKTYNYFTDISVKNTSNLYTSLFRQAAAKENNKSQKKLCRKMLYFYLKMHQNAVGGRALSGPAGVAYSVPPDSIGIAGFRDVTCRGPRKYVGRKRGIEGVKRGGKKGEGRGLGEG